MKYTLTNALGTAQWTDEQIAAAASQQPTVVQLTAIYEALHTRKPGDGDGDGPDA